MKIIPFPNRNQTPNFLSQQARPLGLYLVLAFIFLYLVSVSLVQHFSILPTTSPSSPTTSVAVSSPVK